MKVQRVLGLTWQLDDSNAKIEELELKVWLLDDDAGEVGEMQ